MKQYEVKARVYNVWDPDNFFHRLEFDDGFWYGWENLSREAGLTWNILDAMTKSPKGEYGKYRWEEEK